MVTQTQFDAFKREAISKQPLRKRILLSDLKFHTMDCVEYAGIMLGVNRQGLKDIVRLIGFSVSGGDDLKKSVGEDTAINILNSLKNVIGTVKKEVTLVVTPDRVITRVTPTDNNGLISVETYFDTFERLANVHNLEIQGTSFNSETGAVHISALAGKHEFQVGNLSDEVFRTGLSFSRNLEGIQADPYMHRLVCTNGMVTRQFEESYKLRSMEPKMWEEFYRHLDRIEKSGFTPTKFNAAVERSINAPASLAELERGCQLLTTSSNIPEAELEIFFKGLKNTYNRFNQVGIDTTKLTLDQKRNCRTALTNWDVINGITDFASHNYGYEKKANVDRHLQMQAGDMLARVPDTSNLVLTQPF
jgi:hypothetical protein